MPAVTKADLIAHLFDVVGINKREAKEIVDLFFDEIMAALIQGETIKLPDFGVFKTRKKTSRPGRNPRTGKSVLIEKRQVATFKTAESLKDKIQDYGKSANPEKAPQ
jgi:integration host factor subunit alpha